MQIFPKLTNSAKIQNVRTGLTISQFSNYSVDSEEESGGHSLKEI